jgi:hypothetical protein
MKHLEKRNAWHEDKSSLRITGFLPQDEEQSSFPAKERKRKNLVMGLKGVLDTEADRPTDRRSQYHLSSTHYETVIMECSAKYYITHL